MPTPKESTVVRNILKYLRENGFFAWKLHTGPLSGTTGLPDIIALRNGQMFGFEVKRDRKKKATDLQLRRLAELRNHGAVVGVVCCIEDVQKIIEDYDGSGKDLSEVQSQIRSTH